MLCHRQHIVGKFAIIGFRQIAGVIQKTARSLPGCGERIVRRICKQNQRVNISLFKATPHKNRGRFCLRKNRMRPFPPRGRIDKNFLFAAKDFPRGSCSHPYPRRGYTDKYSSASRCPRKAIPKSPPQQIRRCNIDSTNKKMHRSL